MGATFFTVSWSASPDSHQDDYIVTYRPVGSSEVIKVSTEGATLLKLEGLIPGASYEISVVAVSNNQSSNPVKTTELTREWTVRGY